MRSNWIDALPLAPQCALREAMVPRRYGKGALIYTRSEAPEGLYLIGRGTAQFALDAANGRRLLLRVLRPGDLFGESFALDGMPAPVLVEAREPLEVGLIPAHRLALLEQRFPQIERALARVASANLRLTLEVLVEQALMDLAERIASRLALLCREQGGEGWIRLEYSQAELAAMLGASRQAVNGELARLEARGAIRRGFRAIEVLPALL